MANYQPPRIVVEQSPWQTFFEGLPGMLLGISQMQQQAVAAQDERAWRSSEALLAREFQSGQTELTIAANQYNTLQQRLFSLEDEMKGYTLPYEQTAAGGELISGKLADYQSGVSGTASKISQIQQSLSLIQGAKDFAGEQADLYGGLIKAGEDEVWRDYLLEGGLEVDPEGEIVGTGEMAEWLKVQTPETIDKLKDANYRRAMLTSLRTIEDAKNLEAIDLQLNTLTQQIETSKHALREQKFTHAVAQHEEMEGQIGEIYKNVALSVKSSFRYVSDELVYDLPSLLTIAATEPSDFLEIKSNFLSDPANYDIAHEAEQFLSGIQTAAISDIDDAEYVSRFAKQAYDDFLLLKEYEAEITAEAALENKTAAELYRTLPSTDVTKIAIERLRAKQKGYKNLGLYDMGMAMLDRASAIVSMHNDQQALRLNIDVEEADRISREGLGLQDIETYYPSNQEYMTPKMQRDLDWSLESLKAADPDTSRNSIASLEQSVEAAKASLSSLEVIGVTSGVLYDELRSNLSNAQFELNKGVGAENIAEFNRILEENITNAASVTGKSVEEVRAAYDEKIEEERRRAAIYNIQRLQGGF